MAKRIGWVAAASLCLIASGAACSRDSSLADPAVETRTSALTSIQNDFEDGTNQGWIPRDSTVVLTNTTEQAFAGTHSLKTTNRTQPFHGPSLDVTSQMLKGATYQLGVSVRLVAGSAPTTIRLTMQRTVSGDGQQFDTVAQANNVTDGAWVTLTNPSPYSFSTDVTNLLLYVEATDPTVSYYIDSFSLVQLTPAPLSSDFEDGSLQGWQPKGAVTLTNTTDQAFAGTRSLLTSGRTHTFDGPSFPLTGQLARGATYGVTVSARLVTGTPATTLRVTMQRTIPGGTNAFDFIAQNTNVTDSAWVTMTGTYTFNTDVTGLLLYVESTSATASYYIDSFSITQLAPPPQIPPPNTAGAAATFEDGGTDGWFSRTNVEVVANSIADAHTGTHSLLTTNRTGTFRGPAFNVTNVMFNGSRYHVELWAKLAPGETSTQLRVSLQQNLGSFATNFITLIGNQTVTANGWVLFQTTFDDTLANTSLTLYVESATSLASFYIDDFKITFIAPAVAERDIPSVWQTVADQFPVGSAVRAADLSSGESAFLLTKHFNSITSENDMKWDATEASEGTFTFTNADPQVAFAKQNNMRVRGHTLVWHNQIPAWVFTDPTTGLPMTPNDANRTLLIQRMQNHVRGVMNHFGTDVGTWDVVNEAIDQSQPDGYRRSPWFDIIGPEYIDIAFQTARDAQPTAKLYYNDFSTTDTTKLAFIAALVSGMKSRGVPIDGVGHQMHNNVDFPSGAAVINAINTIDALGVENSVTELDVSIYSGSFSTPVLDYTNIPPDRFLLQGYRYLTFFQAFKQLQGKIKSVTFWGKADNQTWLTTPTQVDGPLLFDISFKHKLAYWAVVDPLQLPGADLSTTMTAAPVTVPAGSAVAYTITVTNNADTNQQPFDPTDDDLPAANVSLSTAVPANTTFQSLTVPAGWSCNQPGLGGTGPVQCTIASLPVGGVATFTLTVAVPDCKTADGSFISASANVRSSTADPNPAPNNAASVSVQVSNAPPVITANGPLDVTVECATAYADQGATATDACEGPVPVTSSSTVDVGHVGDYTVSYNTADQAGSQATPVVRAVHVADTTPPAVTVAAPNPTTLECATSFVDLGATAADSCVGNLQVATVGSVDAGTPGNYTLGYTATDPSGNTGTASRLVTVIDTIAPVVTVRGANPATVECATSFTDPGATAADSCAGSVSVTTSGAVDVNTPGSYTLGYSAADPAGNLASASRLVSVRDGTPPAMTVVAPLTIGPPNHKYHAFAIADLVRSVTDGCSRALGIADVVITKVTSDEPDNGCGDGDTVNDIVIGADCRSVQLRAERDEGANGRVYTIALHVTDAAGNRTDAAVKVTVPVGHNPAVDDGPRFTVASRCP